MNRKPIICIECQKCLTLRREYLCRKDDDKWRLNYVTGIKEYKGEHEFCRDINTDGNCKYFKNKEEEL